MSAATHSRSTALTSGLPASSSGRRGSHRAQVDTADRMGRTVRRDTVDAFQGIGKLRLLELIGGFALIFEGAFFGIPLPFNQVVMIGLIVLALTRRPTRDLNLVQWAFPLLTIGLLYLGLFSLFAEPTAYAGDWKRRLLRMGLTLVFLGFLAAGRLCLRSLLTGLGIGLVVNLVAFLMGLNPNYYNGALSGWFVDKNVAGLSYALYGILLLFVVRKTKWRLLLFIAGGGMLWMTGSRTSLAGLTAAAVWILISPYLPVIGRWLLGVATYAGVVFAAEDYSQIGVFSDREGSDLLRARIDAASELKVKASGFFGDGLGEAYVVFPDNPDKAWFFHNSYWTALVEGGWPWLVLVLGVTVLVGAKPFTRVLSREEILVQAATVAVLVCCWRLGEVFMTVQWALVMGVALYVSARPLDVDPLAKRGSHRQSATTRSRVRTRS